MFLIINQECQIFRYWVVAGNKKFLHFKSRNYYKYTVVVIIIWAIWGSIVITIERPLNILGVQKGVNFSIFYYIFFIFWNFLNIILDFDKLY